jgi:hypothetical protein
VAARSSASTGISLGRPSVTYSVVRVSA